jgi:hypothetical protein
MNAKKEDKKNYLLNKNKQNKKGLRKKTKKDIKQKGRLKISAKNRGNSTKRRWKRLSIKNFSKYKDRKS